MSHPYQLRPAAPEITISVTAGDGWLTVPDEVDDLTAVTVIAAALCSVMDAALTPGGKINLIAGIAEQTGVSLGTHGPASRVAAEDDDNE